MTRDLIFRGVVAAKQRLARSKLLRQLPLVEYTYALDSSAAIHVPELNLAFVPTPKVANRSIKAAVMTVAFPGYNGDPHSPGWSYIRAHTLSKGHGFRFGFVRNPLDRLFSLYSQKIVKYERQMKMPSIFWRYGSRFHPNMTFDAFVEAICGIPDWYADQHFRSQHTWFHRKSELLVDFVGRFERLDEDWEEVRRRVQAALPPLPHWNQSEHRPYREAYSKRTLALASRRYERDIALFGYEEEVAELRRELGG